MEASIKDYIQKIQQDNLQFEKDWQDILDNSISLSNTIEKEALEIFRLFEFPVSI